jgi:hypothetical protein
MQPRVSNPLPWQLGLAALAAVCLVVGLIAVEVGVGNQQMVCQTTNGATTSFSGCVGDTSGIWWGGILAVLGILLSGLTLAVATITAALRSRATV